MVKKSLIKKVVDCVRSAHPPVNYDISSKHACHIEFTLDYGAKFTVHLHPVDCGYECYIDLGGMAAKIDIAFGQNLENLFAYVVSGFNGKYAEDVIVTSTYRGKPHD